MIAVIVFLLALLPVLAIGVALINLLLENAPRRGKWPYPVSEERRRSRPAKRRVRVLCADGRLLEGTPRQLAARLGAGRYGKEPAEEFLRGLAAAGRILMQDEDESRA